MIHLLAPFQLPDHYQCRHNCGEKKDSNSRAKKKYRHKLTIVHTADFVQDLYLKELKAYKIPPVKDSDADGQVQTFTLPQTPKSPEEADLASSLKEYESMAVEIEGQDATQTQQGAATLPDWLEAEEEEEVKH
jgi:F-type H+-transporting ATPase subunit h